MPAPVPLPVRRDIWSRFQLGQSAAAIASDLQLSPRTVQYLVCRFQERPTAPLATSYAAPSAAETEPPFLVRKALFLHQEHPTWGAGYIRVRLALQHPDLDLPSVRTLQRWWRRLEQPPAPPGRKPPPSQRPATHVHDVWQVDASEEIRLASGQKVSWLRCVEEFSGAVLGTHVFPPRPLGAGAAAGRAGAIPAVIPAVGMPAVPARGQRSSVGQQ